MTLCRSPLGYLPLSSRLLSKTNPFCAGGLRIENLYLAGYPESLGDAAMPKTLEKWTVLPHGRLTEIDQGIWTVTGEVHMPLTPLERRMTVVRLKNGDLVIYSAIALDEPQMRILEDAGHPAYLIVPGDHHRMDAGIWKARYPDLSVIAPPSARQPVAEVVAVDATTADFGDKNVSLFLVKGMSGHEAALIVRRPSGTTIVVNDIIGNMPHDAGFVLRLMQFAGDKPHVPLPVKMTLKDKEGLRAQLLSWANEPNLVRLIVSHGEPIEKEVRQQLQTLADSLVE